MTSKYEFIDAEKADHAIVWMCAWLRVSRSGYYEWSTRPMSAAAERRERLKLMIQAVFDANHETYGYRRIHAVLVRSGEEVSDELVRRLMREMGLQPVQPQAVAAGHHPGRRSRRHPRPGQPGLHRRTTWRQAGWRHHLHPHLGRFSLFGDRH